MTTTTYLCFAIILIALVCSCTVFFQRNPELYLRLFPYFMVFVIVNWSWGSYLAAHNKSNLILFNLYIAVGVIFYLFVTSQIIRNRLVKKIIVFSFVIYPIIACWNMFRPGPTI